MATVVGVAPVTARATLVFVRNPLKPTVWAAADDGAGKRRVARGTNPDVSPDGQWIAYMRLNEGRVYRPRLMVVPAGGGAPPRLLAKGWWEPYVFAWSPDSSTIATVRGPELGRRRLVLIDVASGAQRTIATGYFSGVSFAPEGGQLVYSRAAKETFPPRSDVYRLDLLPAGAQSIALGALTSRLTREHGSLSRAPTEFGLLAERPHRLTRDYRSLSPLWGPNGKIVFVKLLGARRRRYAPKNELYLMDPSGGAVRRLTHTRVGPLLSGLTPTQWSADGDRLLAEFGGQDTSYAVTVSPRTGAQRTLTKARERGFVGTSLSADGSRVLGMTGGYEPGPGHDVLSIPYGGGRGKVLARNAFQPDWSR